MTPIMLGIIGARGFANSPHNSIVEAQPDRFQIAAVYDPSPERGLQWSGRSHAAAYNSLRDLLSHQELDAVFIARSAASARYEAAQSALEAGLHVVLERPMAASTAQCDQLIQRARRKGVTLTVAHLRRWDRQTAHALSRIDSGEIGDPLIVKIAGPLPEEDGLLFSDCLDMLDLAQLFNESRLQEVSAAPNARSEDALESLTALFRFEEPPCVELSLLPSSKTAVSVAKVDGGRKSRGHRRFVSAGRSKRARVLRRTMEVGAPAGKGAGDGVLGAQRGLSGRERSGIDASWASRPNRTAAQSGRIAVKQKRGTAP